MNYGQRFVTLNRRQRSRPSPWKRNAKKAKWLSEEALQIAVKRREVKRKGEKESYKHLNVEFQRLARTEKKAFLSDQRKEIEENNRMGKARDLFKKIRNTRGTENEGHGIWSHHFMGNKWGNSGNSVRLYFFGLQNHCRW